MPRRTLILLVAACAVIGFAVFVALRPTVLFGVNGTALSASVQRSINAHSSESPVAVDRCSSHGSGEWTCTGDLDPGSNALFGVRIQYDGRCWTGEALLRQVFGRSHRGAGDLRGCIRPWDYSGIAL
jgi:hypothetical protein